MRTHVLRNAMLPVVTMLGMDIGVALRERASSSRRSFGLPGLGRLLTASAAATRPPVDARDHGRRHVAVVIVEPGRRPPLLVLDPRCACTRRPLSEAPRGAVGAARTPRAAEPASRELEPVRPRLLVVRARARADDRLPGLAAREQDRGRDREHAVARRRSARFSSMFSFANSTRPACSVGELARGPARPPCRAAPRRPEVDDDRPVGAAAPPLERRVGDLAHASRRYRRPASAGARRSGTFQIASSTIARLIFEPPDLAVGERDRHLDDAEAGPERAVGRLDLEGVALRVDRVEVDRLEHGAPVALEPAGQVAHRRRRAATCA